MGPASARSITAFISSLGITRAAQAAWATRLRTTTIAVQLQKSGATQPVTNRLLKFGRACVEAAVNRRQELLSCRPSALKQLSLLGRNGRFTLGAYGFRGLQIGGHDRSLHSPWGASFPVRGREIDATVLFADITAFSARTQELTPTETLIFVNNFFAWISAEALRHTSGLIDKYIGDEVMVVFSKEFGATDPFLEAVQAARWMAENDVLAFWPHMGIASGRVIVGYAGTPLRYNCSVFGAPVALAARCAGIAPDDEGHYSSSITFPASEWGKRELGEVFPAKEYELPDGTIGKQPAPWELLGPRSVEIKNLPDIEVREILRRGTYMPMQSAENRAQYAMSVIERAGRYWPGSPLPDAQ